MSNVIVVSVRYSEVCQIFALGITSEYAVTAMGIEQKIA